MLHALKSRLRRSPLRPAYLWLANRYRSASRLTSYPNTARVGVVDYDAYWDKKAQSGMGILSPWRLKRVRVFARIVAPGEHVLDLGVGDGALLTYLIRERGVTGYGLDVSPKAVDFCVAQGLNVKLSDINQPIGDIITAQFGPDVRFDHVIMSEIIEHLPDPETLLLALRPFARNSLIVSVPNTGYYQHRLRLLLGKFPLQWVVTPGEHLRYWTLADFRWWARQLGFRVGGVYPYEGTPGLKRVWPSLFAAAFVFQLR